MVLALNKQTWLCLVSLLTLIYVFAATHVTIDMLSIGQSIADLPGSLALHRLSGLADRATMGLVDG